MLCSTRPPGRAVSGSKRGKRNLKRSAHDSTTSSTPASDNSSSLREFLYLDFPKVTSYLAQIDEGNVRTRQEYRGYNERELARDATVETTVSGGAGGSVDASPLAADLGNLNLGKFLSLIGRIDANVTRLVRGGGDEHELNNARYQVAVKEVHHEAFTDVESYLDRRGLIADDLRERHKKPFVRVSGLAEVMDFSKLAESVKTWEEFGETFAELTGQESFATGDTNYEALAKLLSRFYWGRLGVVVHVDGRTVTAYLETEHFTTNTQSILDNYGHFTQIPITLFGLQTGKAYPEDQTSGETTFLDNLPSEMSESGFGAMARTVMNSNRGMEGMERFFRLRGDIHVYPIAAFLRLE